MSSSRPFANRRSCSGDLRIERANSAFYESFGVKPAKTIGKILYDLGRREWDIPTLRRVLDGIVRGSHAAGECSIEREFNRLGRRTMLFNARRMRDAGQPPLGEPTSTLMAPERPDEQSRIQERVRRGEGTNDYETVCRRNGA